MSKIMHIELKPAKKDDASLIFSWRNDKKTREASLENQELNFEDHLEWTDKVLADPNRHLLMAYHEQKPIGVLRFDQQKENIVVSIYLDPSLHGQGYGTAILKAGVTFIKTTFSEALSLSANILIENIASKKAFLKAGFKEKYLVMEYAPVNVSTKDEGHYFQHKQNKALFSKKNSNLK